jgi:type I restriction-modification system DNA methylase subunit
MSNISLVIKSIQDLMRKDVGVDDDAQRISQLVWMFFLKIYDDRVAEIELLDDVPVEELTNATFDIWNKYITFPADSLAAEIARSFGFNRVTKSTAQVGELTLSQMIDQQLSTLAGGNYKITNISPK